MSIYDDLANSGYLNQEDLKNQFQQTPQQLEQSIVGSNKFVNFNHYDVNSSHINQDEVNFNDDEHYKYGGGSSITYTKSQINQNYQNAYQPSDHLTEQDFFGLPSDAKSPIAMASDNSQMCQRQNMFGQKNSTNDSDTFLKDSSTGLQYNQPQRKLMLGDEEIISPHQRQEMKTGRFATNQVQDESHCYLKQQPVPFNDDINKFKNQNEQIQQLLQQLQVPFNNIQGQNQQPCSNMEMNNFNHKDSPYSQYHRSRSENLQNQLIMPSQYQYPTFQGPNFEKLNKDNSILEIAKMQNSGNGSDNITNQSLIENPGDQLFNRNYGNISKDFSYAKQQQPLGFTPLRQDNLGKFQQHQDNQDNGNSIMSSQKLGPHYSAPLGALIGNVSKYDQENIDQNIFQIRGVVPFHPEQSLINDSQLIKHQQQQLQQQQQQQLQYQQQFQMQHHQQINIKRAQSQMDIMKQELMKNFDDIPIQKFHQEQKKMNDENEDLDENDETSLSLLEQIEHPKWKIRMNAYKEISSLFYNEYSKDCLKNKGEKKPDEDNEVQIKPFDQYGSVLQKIISDTNLVAQYEGLNCLFAFIKFSPDIKSVIFQVNGILLEKIQHNKPNFKEITTKILINILKKDKSQSLLPEILKRFKNKNTKIATFASEVILESLKSQILNDGQTMKTLFKASSENLGHCNKELREIALDLISHIYKNCDDDVNIFMRNIKTLRPVQEKDVKEHLQDIEKLKNGVYLFKLQQQSSQINVEGFSPKKNTIKDQEYDQEDQEQAIETIDSDLTLLLPENFQEIPYINQINTKKNRMSTFNEQLEKLIHSKNQNFQVQNKDYTQIFNIVTHMLEDSNALVFMEAIKTVEYLSILLGKNLKPQKLKQFIALLADKYKETKTAPVQAVNKVLTTIIKRQNLPFSQIIDYMINQIAFNSKNARVKQLLMEKVDQTILEEPSLQQDEQLLSQIFKAIKDKTIGFIQKDTNASVRDAAVSLISTFKTFLSQNQMINETINTLPKYRITEIIKLAQEKGQSLQTRASVCSSQNQIQKIDKSGSQVFSNKETSDDFFYQGRNISGQYQIHLAEIILSLKKMAQSNNFGISSFQSKWDDAIESLGEIGVKESKSVIVSCIHWLFSKHNGYIKDSQQIIETILNLMKKIFCIERSVEIQGQSGISKELNEAIQNVLMCAKWVNNTKQLENVFNVILAASPSIAVFIDNVNKGFNFIKSQDQESDFITALEFTFKWFSLKLDQLLSKGITFSDLEDLRSLALSYLEDINEQNQKNRLIQIMVTFKNTLNEKKKKMEYIGDESSIAHDEDQQDEEEKKEVNKILDNLPRSNEPEIKSMKLLGLQFIDVIDQDYESGIQMLKSFQINPQILDFTNKEIIFNKLLSKVSIHCKNPIQQQQQAFTLKAMLWMKEELLGIEDCFKFTPNIMISYSNTEMQGRDCSIELYLLNNWVKQLRLRDLIDRVSYACTLNEEIFISIFGWLMMHSLNGNQEEKWQIEDFRKLSVSLAQHIREQQVQEFFSISVDKFGIQKVKQFMEIQLMHNPQEYNNFMRWVQQTFRESTEEIKKEKVKFPEIILDRAESQPKKKFEDLQLKDALQNNDISQLNDESVTTSARANKNIHSKLYQEMREKRKHCNQRKNLDTEDGLNKYDQIINRLEVQLQQQNFQSVTVEEKKSIEKERNFQFHQSNSNNFYQQEKSSRYLPSLDNEEEEEEHEVSQISKQLDEIPSILGNHSKMTSQEIKLEHKIEDKEETLQESTMKEGLWKLELEKLEKEKKRIEFERCELLQAKNKETAEWRQRYDVMRQEHEDVINNLREANKCYLTQVGENEELKKQLQEMQNQNKLMMKKFKEFEKKLNSQEEQAILEKHKIQKNDNVAVIKQEQLTKVENIFKDFQIQSMRGEEEIGTKKIQELLLNFDDKEETQRIGHSLFIHYQQLKVFEQKQRLVRSLTLALDNEDVLYALPLETYKTLLDFNLQVFANEKAALDHHYIGVSIESASRKNTLEQNEITVEVQKLVSKLLNSKEFTTSLVTLFQILRNAMPSDLGLDLQEEQKQYLRVIMRCISRITKALHSENPDLIRAFDVLIEMQKIFIKNPPENLREDLPCLQDFDSVYRGLKDVTDKLMELQPEKVMTFLEFVKNQPQNAFIKYMNQIMAPRQQHKHEYSEEELYDEEGY